MYPAASCLAFSLSQVQKLGGFGGEKVLIDLGDLIWHKKIPLVNSPAYVCEFNGYKVLVNVNELIWYQKNVTENFPQDVAQLDYV